MKKMTVHHSKYGYDTSVLWQVGLDKEMILKGVVADRNANRMARQGSGFTHMLAVGPTRCGKTAIYLHTTT